MLFKLLSVYPFKGKIFQKIGVFFVVPVDSVFQYGLLSLLDVIELADDGQRRVSV